MLINKRSLFMYFIAVMMLIVFESLVVFGSYKSGYAMSENEFLLERDAYVKALDLRREQNAELVRKLEQEKQSIQVRQIYVDREVVKYVTAKQKSSDCNLTVGAVRLYNVSLGYGDVKHDTGKSFDSPSQASTVTGAAFVRECNQLAGEYDGVYKQLGALAAACG